MIVRPWAKCFLSSAFGELNGAGPMLQRKNYTS
jgi:hypothetical protein